MTEKIRTELEEFVATELKEAERFETREEVRMARNRAFGAVLFAFRVCNELFADGVDWWNEDILEKFNAIMGTKR